MIDALVSRGDSFRDCAPRADDVWLNYVAAAEDIRVAQVLRRPRMFALLAGTQASGLLHSNAFGAENDRQIALTYDQGAIDRVRVG
ncbi:hypothetical protein [Microbacterium sp. NPDC080220]|uniref:hypothetical protein n=1 Tax=Microbacterium sp. NPDC080220 TaxID=3161017 RepID=UPI00341223CE